MMPIMNVFNEWHAASTSKKIRAVIETNAKLGKYRSNAAHYGFVKENDENRLPVRDEPAASYVLRMFQMRAKGISPNKIADALNEEGIKPPCRLQGIKVRDSQHKKIPPSLVVRYSQANSHQSHLSRTSCADTDNHVILQEQENRETGPGGV